MSEFQSIGSVRDWKLGSIIGSTGSEYLFGYDVGDQELMWLERSGIRYGPSDKEWRTAERFIQTRLSSDVPAPDSTVSLMGSPSVSDERPRTVTRSAAGMDQDMPSGLSDERIVGDLSVGMGTDIDDDDISTAAYSFLTEGGTDDF